VSAGAPGSRIGMYGGIGIGYRVHAVPLIRDPGDR